MWGLNEYLHACVEYCLCVLRYAVVSDLHTASVPDYHIAATLPSRCGARGCSPVALGEFALGGTGCRLRLPV